jgi:hypothetical protein
MKSIDRGKGDENADGKRQGGAMGRFMQVENPPKQ